MISRFTNLFKKSDGDEQRAFQKRIVRILKDLHPEISITQSVDPMKVESSGRVLGLTNIHATYLLSTKTESDLREIVAEHFKIVTANWEILERGELSWEDAKPMCMPQLMPIAFLNAVPLVSFPFGVEIVLGFVVDSEKAYSYVTKEDIGRWGVGEAEVYDLALENLSIRSKGIEINAVPSPNGFVVVNTMDGFDSVRIVSPAIREFVGEIIGKPFYFGVPNRDFLVCWEKNDDKDHHDRFRSQLSVDFDERPYPLSRFVFCAKANGDIEQVIAESVDPRAKVAESN